MEHDLIPYEEWPFQGGDAERLYSGFVRGVVPHALLLVGPAPATDAAARFLAKLLLCTAENGRPCGTCDACIQFASGSHPNWHEVPIDGKSLKTQAIEDLQAFLQLRSHGGGPLVYLVPDIDTATPVAANRLLKTLEEPIGPMVAIITAGNVRQVLPTIVSRCHVYRLSDAAERSSSHASVTGNTMEDSTPDAQISEFAALSERVVQWTQSLFSKSEPPLVQASEFHKLEPTTDGVHPIDILLFWLNALMRYGLTREESARFPNSQRHLAEQAARTSSESLAAAIQIVLDTKIRMESHVVGLLNAEQMCVRIWRVFHGLHGGGSPV